MSFSIRAGLLAAVGLACSSGGGTVTLAPTIIFPEGLLDNVMTLSVSVYDPGSGNLACDPTNGTVTGLSAMSMPLATANLTKNTGTNCDSPSTIFCGTLNVSKTSSLRLFAAQAFVGTSTTPVASGCTSQAPSQDTIQVTIKMLRTLPPQTCNGMPTSMLVQCDTGAVGNPVCDQNCQSIEELFSPGDSSSTSQTDSHVRPELTWPSASGAAGRLIGVWGEKRSGGNEVAMRTLDDSMAPPTTGSTCVQQSSFRMPTSSGIPCPGQIYTFSQFNPTVTSANGDYQIAYEDNSAGAQTISLVQLDTNLNPTGAVVNVNGSAPATAQKAPFMALSGSSLFVAWENNGTIVGRTVALPSLTLGAMQTLGTGTGVTVAGTSSGWVATFLNGGNVNMVTIASSGTPGMSAQVPGASGASHPGVAAFGTSVAVIWADSGGNIFVQRFVNGMAVTGDSANALQDASLGGNQKEPSIAAGTNFFVATWVDSASGDVRARFLDGNNGYMFNLVNGQSSDFKASGVSGHQRDNPVAVVGGTAPTFVAIAWEDNTGAPGSFMGVWGRRFPLAQ